MSALDSIVLASAALPPATDAAFPSHSIPVEPTTGSSADAIPPSEPAPADEVSADVEDWVI